MFVSLFLEAVAKYCVKKRIEHAIEKGERVADGFNSVYKFATVGESRIEPEAKIYHVYWQPAESKKCSHEADYKKYFAALSFFVPTLSRYFKLEKR